MTRAMRDKHPFSFVLLMTTVFGGTFVTINLTCWQQLGRITHLSINSHSFLQMRVEFHTKIVAAIAYCNPFSFAYNIVHSAITKGKTITMFSCHPWIQLLLHSLTRPFCNFVWNVPLGLLQNNTHHREEWLRVKRNPFRVILKLTPLSDCGLN